MQREDLKTLILKSKDHKFKSFIHLLYKTESEDNNIKIIQNFIINEAGKRKTSIQEFINYLTGHRRELSELLKEEIPGQLKIFEDKVSPKFKKIYTNKEMERVMHNFLNTQRLQDEGIKNLNDDSIAGAVKIWKGKEVDYIVNVDDLIKLKGRPPKVYVSQIKNISLLMGLTQEQQSNNEIKEAKCEFKLSYYAERRGYTKEQIKEGGNFFNELKRDLISGAYTGYVRVIIEGKKYTVYNSFYGLYVPEDPGINWKVEFNNPYSSWIMEILNGEANQYFITNHKAIEDWETTNNPYLFLFYMQLIKRKRANLLTTPVKVESLLKDMKIDEQILARPKECFELLRECLIYFSKHYQPAPEIEQFFLYNDFHKSQTAKLPLHISEAFKQYPYEDFKDLLKAIGIKDIREAYISFKRPYKNPKIYKLDNKEEQLLDKTLEWFSGQVTRIPREDQEGIIKNYIKNLGYDYYRELFEKEANKTNANAVEFLTKVLPEKLREQTPTRA
jgi:hypothetical protein